MLAVALLGGLGATADVLVPAPAAQAAAPGLRSVHAPGTVSADERLRAGQCHLRLVNGKLGQYLPDGRCTPGAFDPAVTQANIGSTICRTGYTTKVRPSSYLTSKFKTASLAQYGLRSNTTTEYDHLVSLELGGANSVSNLWPEPNKAGARGTTNPKDAVENTLHRAVCSHRVSLGAAQHAIAVNWVTALRALHL